MDKVEIGESVLYHGDCLEILPTLGEVDALVTDPPYGLGDKWQGGGGETTKTTWRFDPKEAKKWDREAPQWISEEFPKYDQCVCWGGHLFNFPPSRGWLVWDKKQRGTWTTGHTELAWTNIDQPIRAYSLSQVEAHSAMHKQHPTQKPVSVMEWAISFTKGNLVLDPFMGSGTTGVACANLGRKFIGIEIQKKYFDMACERIEMAYAQGRLFA